MHTLENTIRQELLALAEPKYQKFSAALIPGCENLLGVRIPLLRKIAQRIAKQDGEAYLYHTSDIYFEETMLKGLIIGNMKVDVQTILPHVAFFVPKITNWSLCDSFCTELKIVKKHPEIFWEFLQPYAASAQAYDIRFAVVLCLMYFREEVCLESLFEMFNQITHEDYYVKMAVAWAVSMCFVSFPERTLLFLQKNRLDDFTYNKSLQKIRESLKVDAETKARIKLMRR